MARALTSEQVDDETLLGRVAAGERFGQRQLLSLLDPLAEQLAEHHRRGEIHGTITPADIRFDAAGDVHLTGFGRDTTPDPVREKPYAPVELFVPVHPQGPWTDIYSLGAVLWHAITGAPPPEVLRRKGDLTLANMAPPGFDPDFLRAVDAALEVAPQRRPQSLEDWFGLLNVRDRRRQGPPAFPLRLGAEYFVPARRRRVRTPLFTIATLDGVAAYDIPKAPKEPATAPPPGRREPAPVAESADGEGAETPRRRWAMAASIAAVVATATLLTLDRRRSEPATVVAVTRPQPPVVEVTPVAVQAVVDQAPLEPSPALDAAEPPTELTPPAVAVSREPPAASPPPARPADTKTPVRRNLPAAGSEGRPAPASTIMPEPALEGATPSTLLARADGRLRALFGDYERLRSEVSASYGSRQLGQRDKERAYRESVRIHDELLDLRKQRNRIARTGSARSANKRFDEFDASAARIDTRMKELRRAI